jgi:hypothetical protein
MPKFMLPLASGQRSYSVKVRVDDLILSVRREKYIKLTMGMENRNGYLYFPILKPASRPPHRWGVDPSRIPACGCLEPAYSLVRHPISLRTRCTHCDTTTLTCTSSAQFNRSPIPQPYMQSLHPICTVARLSVP